MAHNNKRWTILLAAIITEACTGIGYAWSVFQNPLIEKYGWTTSAVSIAFTLFILAGAMAPLFGKLQEYLQTKTIVLIGAVIYGVSLYATGMVQSIPALYLCFGLGVGAGTTMIYPLVISHMVKIFPEKKGLISGVMVASYGSGAVILAPTGAWLVSRYDIDGAFKVLGVALFLIIAACSRLIRDYRARDAKDIREVQSNSFPDVEMTWGQMLRTPIFYIVFVALTIGATSGLMILGHASPMLQSAMNIPAQKAAFIVGILAAANALGRLFWGGISDKLGRYPLLMLLFVLSTVSFLALATSGFIPLFLSAVLLVELCYGGYISLIAPITADLFGTRHLSINYGFMFISFAIGGVIGPRIAAITKEMYNGSYQVAFFIAMILCIVGLGLAFSARFMIRRNKSLENGTQSIAA